MIIPSLDILNNKIVRLIKGNIKNIFFYGYFKEYINFYVSINIKKLHIVILDNIFYKKKNIFFVNKKIICQVGGGFKNITQVKDFFSKNFKKIILSSLIFKNKVEFKKIISLYKKKILISLDCYKNKIIINGWKLNTNFNFNKIFFYLIDLNIKYIIYTNIEKDGTLLGINRNDFLIFKNKINLCSFCISGGVKNFNIFMKNSFIKTDFIVGISLYKFFMKIKYLC